jgi:hypothetical protein
VVRRTAWVGLVFVVVCFAVVALSAGTLNRANNGLTLADANDLGFTLAVTVSSVGSPMLVSLLNAPLAFAAWLLVAGLIGWSHPVALTFKTRRQLAFWVIGVIVVMAGVIGLPFIPIAYFVGSGLVVHMWVLPMVAWLVESAALAWMFGRARAGYQVRVLGERNKLMMALALLAVLGTALPAAWQARSTQATYAQAWDARHQAIQAILTTNTVTPATAVRDSPYDTITTNDQANNAAIRPLVIASLRAVSPFRWEVRSDPQNFANQCVASYYRVARVVAADDPEAE